MRYHIIVSSVFRMAQRFKDSRLLNDRIQSFYARFKAAAEINVDDVAEELFPCWYDSLLREWERPITHALHDLWQEENVRVHDEVEACIKQLLWREIRRMSRAVERVEEKGIDSEARWSQQTAEIAALKLRNRALQQRIAVVVEEKTRLQQVNAEMGRMVNDLTVIKNRSTTFLDNGE